MNYRLSNLLQFSRRRTKAAESVECLFELTNLCVRLRRRRRDAARRVSTPHRAPRTVHRAPRTVHRAPCTVHPVTCDL